MSDDEYHDDGGLDDSGYHEGDLNDMEEDEFAEVPYTLNSCQSYRYYFQCNLNLFPPLFDRQCVGWYSEGTM